MTGLAHVALHLALCSAAARVPPQTTIAMHVRLVDRINRPQIDQVYRLERGYGDAMVVESDVLRGVYRLQISLPKYHCSASDFLAFLPDRTRNVTERLSASRYTETVPLLLNGTTPTSFLYAEPTFVIFERSSVCNKPVAGQFPFHVTVEYDSDGYYAQLYSDPSIEARGSVLVALRLKTATSQYHYIRVPMNFPIGSTRWPVDVQFNVTEDYLDTLATEPVDTLLCPKLLRTSVE